MEKITKAIIPAAGLGTRFLPITKSIPKEMLPIGSSPVLEYVVKEAQESGINEILIIINEEKESIKNYFSVNATKENRNDRLNELQTLLNKVKISFAVQKELSGNGAAILLGEKFTEGKPFAVLFGDNVVYSENRPCTQQLIEAYEKTGTCILGCQQRPPLEAVKFGVVKKGEENGRLTKVLELIEKPDVKNLPSNLCSLGRFVLTSDVFDALRKAPLFKNEIYLTVALSLLIKDKGLFAYEFSGKHYDIGNENGFLKANVDYALKNNPRETLAYLKSITDK